MNTESDKPKFRRGRRVKAISCRPLKLNEAQRADVTEWLKIPHTLEAKAKALGISRQTLSAYIHNRHKPRKEEIDIDATAEILSLQIGQVPQVSRDAEECTPQSHA